MLLTDEMIDTALNAVSTAVVELMSGGVLERKDLHIVVATRDRAYVDGYRILEERSFGDILKWENPYARIARGKTALTARTGLSSRVVQKLDTELLRRGDVKFWGNAIKGDLIVSCSGVQPHYDEAISKMVMDLLLAAIEERSRTMLTCNDLNTYDGDY